MAIQYPGSPRIPNAVNPLEYGLAGLMEGWGEGRERLQEKQGVNAFGRYLDTQGGAPSQPMSLASLGGGQAGGGRSQALPALSQIGPKPASAAEAVQKMGADPSGKSPIDLASGLIGAGEKPHRAQIQEYLKNGGVNLDPATTAWCAAYVNATLGQAGIKGTGSNMARSFLNYGEAVDTPERGDIAIYSRGDPNGPYGHVGFVDAVNPDGSVNLLGGNQGNAVSVKRYGTDGLLGYRRIAASSSGADGGGVQIADGSPGNSSFPQFTPQPQARQALPDRDTMLELFRNPSTRPLAIEIAKRAQQGLAPQETFSTIERPDGSVWQMNNLTGQLNRVAEGQQPRAGVSIGGDIVDPTNGRVIYDGPDDAPKPVEVGGALVDPSTGREIYRAPPKPGFRQATPEEAARYGSPAGQIGPDDRFYPINPPQGMTVESDGQGGVRVVQGAGVQNRPLTEGQSKDAVYATRAEGALGILDQYAGNLTSRTDRALDYIPGGFGRDYQETDFQLAQQAGDEFLQAILRKDTGAAITTQEQALYGTTYLPRPGDSEQLLTQKKQSRQRALQAIKAGMPPAAIVQQELALRKSGDAVGSEEAPGTSVVLDPIIVPGIEGMTDEELEAIANGR